MHRKGKHDRCEGYGSRKRLKVETTLVVYEPRQKTMNLKILDIFMSLEGKETQIS
jgi:hypothetical protein